ncbi:mandelate racemase [Neorhizobium lilium]|uniref:Mandelate racemase n=1 Tax=Neorhizobium lilium TaxID=2503024 RepID=A0A3S3SFW3_9HYPH|nr:mandelate racemase [Neorhizobium lilium]RWX79339.1 mandelate racemase [Neorhizobium lilium]
MGSQRRLKVRQAEIRERRLSMRLPFRFGAATVQEASQIFLALEVADENGQVATGYAAELMVPKWFDKNPSLSNADNEAQLRRSLAVAVDLATAAEPLTAFGLHAAIEPSQHGICEKQGLNGLIASFGLALVDRAVLDALCRINDVPVHHAIAANLPGMDASTTSDLAGFDIPAFLSGLKPASFLHLRHTVGYADALTAGEMKIARLDDGLPECLEEEIRTYGIEYFKIKLSGNPTADLERLRAVAAVLDRLPHYRATMDGNEQFADGAAVADLLDRIEAEPALQRLRASLLFIEQPIARANALSTSVAGLGSRIALEIDESDGDPDAFLRARAQGYKGISSKSCKGFYRALLNAMRVTLWNGQDGSGYFMSAEDLTTQAGIALQQDLALAGLLDLGHIERNGHHYVDGMSGASSAEVQAWSSSHGDLYHRTDGGRLRLKVERGRLALGSVNRAAGLGFSEHAAQATFASL